MLRELCRPRWLLGALLLAGAALFTIGVAAERHAVADHAENVAETAPAATELATIPSAAETGGDEAAHTDEATSDEPVGHSESKGEAILGLDVESNALVGVAILVSLALAVLTWRWNRRGLLLATVAVAVVFAVFDVAEVAHQFTESRTGLAVLAAGVAVVHLAAAAVATSVSGHVRGNADT